MPVEWSCFSRDFADSHRGLHEWSQWGSIGGCSIFTGACFLSRDIPLLALHLKLLSRLKSYSGVIGCARTWSRCPLRPWSMAPPQLCLLKSLTHLPQGPSRCGSSLLRPWAMPLVSRPSSVPNKTCWVYIPCFKEAHSRAVDTLTVPVHRLVWSPFRNQVSINPSKIAVTVEKQHMEPLVTISEKQGKFRELKVQQSSVKPAHQFSIINAFWNSVVFILYLRESNTPLMVSLRQKVIFFNNIQGICFKLLENHWLNKCNVFIWWMLSLDVTLPSDDWV